MTYQVDICCSSSCTCPDYQKNGKEVYCKHILFLLKFVDENLFKEKSISHGDIEKLLKSVKKETVQQYSQELKKNNTSEISITRGNQLLLRNHQDFEKECTVFLKKIEGRQAKCRGKVCKKEIEIGAVLVGLTIPFNTDHVVSQTMYFVQMAIA